MKYEDAKLWHLYSIPQEDNFLIPISRNETQIDTIEIHVHKKAQDLYITDDYIMKEDWDMVHKENNLPMYVYQKIELASLEGKDHILRQIVIYCLKGKYSQII